ncbi:glucan biosynthesis protein D [soil metagenome]
MLLFGFLVVLGITTGVTAKAQEVSLASVQEKARRLAAEPYRPPHPVASDTLKAINYDQYLRIRFRPEKALWHGSASVFRAEFFPAGFLFSTPVSVFVVREGKAVAINGADLFDFSAAKVTPDTAEVPIAGVRLKYPLHGSKLDEVISFLGASYYRPLGRNQAYGASARGLAIDTGLPRPEEFPQFKTFWMVTPVDGAREATIWALLDTPAAAGAFSFTVRPGARTVTEVSATLYMRHDVSLMGLAPLTSMYLMGKSGPRRDDFRPEVHDSDGLLMLTGGGERIWRPLTNPKTLSVSSFTDRDPRGFGLMQRERAFAQYLDIQANYHLRPGLWVEPVGNWGEGEVRLLELPTSSEVHDNITAFWAPRTPPRKGERLDTRYRLSARADEPVGGPEARVVATRTSALADRPRHRLIVVEFAGGDLDSMAAELPVEAVVSTTTGKVGATRVERPTAGNWRMVIELEPDGGKPMDLRGFLRLNGEALTETWTYLMRP